MEKIQQIKSSIMKYQVASAAVLVILIVGVYMIMHGNSAEITPSTNEQKTVTGATAVPATPVTSKPKSPTVVTTTGNTCNVTISYPKANTAVTFPLTIKGSLDVLNKNCTWNEGSLKAGTLEVAYNIKGTGWRTPGIAVPINIDNTSQSTTTLNFTSTVNLPATALGVVSGTPLRLTFTELNISNNPAPRTFTVIVYEK